MRYAVLSDIHANGEALDAVLARIAGVGVDGYLCLGDLVGYGPDPGRAVDTIRSLGAVTVRGNHDHAAVEQGEERHFNSWAAEAIRWTRERLTSEELQYLAGLPLSARVNGVLLVHATPSAPAAWRYLLSSRSAASEFAAFEEALCLIGHSHVPMIVSSGSSGRGEADDAGVALEPGVRHIVNVGSVGQPRDRDPRAAYAILDLESRRLRIERVAYDAGATRRKILDAGLPAFLGDRLLEGE